MSQHWDPRVHNHFEGLSLDHPTLGQLPEGVIDAGHFVASWDIGWPRHRVPDHIVDAAEVQVRGAIP